MFPSYGWAADFKLLNLFEAFTLPKQQLKATTKITKWLKIYFYVFCDITNDESNSTMTIDKQELFTVYQILKK